MTVYLQKFYLHSFNNEIAQDYNDSDKGIKAELIARAEYTLSFAASVVNSVAFFIFGFVIAQVKRLSSFTYYISPGAYKTLKEQVRILSNWQYSSIISIGISASGIINPKWATRITEYIREKAIKDAEKASANAVGKFRKFAATHKKELIKKATVLGKNVKESEYDTHVNRIAEKLNKVVFDRKYTEYVRSRPFEEQYEAVRLIKKQVNAIVDDHQIELQEVPISEDEMVAYQKKLDDAEVPEKAKRLIDTMSEMLGDVIVEESGAIRGDLAEYIEACRKLKTGFVETLKGEMERSLKGDEKQKAYREFSTYVRKQYDAHVNAVRKTARPAPRPAPLPKPAPVSPKPALQGFFSFLFGR